MLNYTQYKPFRKSLGWGNIDFYFENEALKESYRVFDICIGCRRCFNLCKSFPKLFDLADDNDGELPIRDNMAFYSEVIDNCYLCDICYSNKCPYVPPHKFALDFPMLMLRMKSIKFKSNSLSLRDNILSRPDILNRLSYVPGFHIVFNYTMNNQIIRNLMDKFLKISSEYKFRKMSSESFKANFLSRYKDPINKLGEESFKHKVVLFSSCYTDIYHTEVGSDIVDILEFNRVKVDIVNNNKCCNMPRFELGDLNSVHETYLFYKNIFIKYIKKGYQIVSTMPSCTFMFTHIWELMYPNDKDISLINNNTFDIFVYLDLLHKNNELSLEFKNEVGNLHYHFPCHLRAQSVGNKVNTILSLIPGTKVNTLNRCSGHNGTYGVKSEFYKSSNNICKPIINKINRSDKTYKCSSDCMLAVQNLNKTDNNNEFKHPISLLKYAYGI